MAAFFRNTAATERRRGPGRPFLKGVSGNPAGRPRGRLNQVTVDMQALARSIVEDPDVQARLLADARRGVLPAPIFIALLHYGYGKPKDTVKVEGIEALVVRIVDEHGNELDGTRVA